MGKSGAPGRSFACNLRVRSAALYTLSHGSFENDAPGPRRRKGIVGVGGRAIHPPLYKSGEITCPSTLARKWRKPEVMLPIPRCGTICFRNSPGALVRFNFQK